MLQIASLQNLIRSVLFVFINLFLATMVFGSLPVLSQIADAVERITRKLIFAIVSVITASVAFVSRMKKLKF